MAILATVRCKNMRTSLAFYTDVLDFVRIEGDDDLTDPCFSTLSRNGDRLLLSSHSGDGEFGQVIVVTTDDVDALFRKFRQRGLRGGLGGRRSDRAGESDGRAQDARERLGGWHAGGSGRPTDEGADGEGTIF